MEENFRNNDFEEYVRGHADQHRMFPSEKVWNAVDSALHPRRKWYGFGLAFLLLLTGTAVTWVMNTYPVSEASGLAVAGKPKAEPVVEPNAAKEPALEDLSPFTHQASNPHTRHFQEPVPEPQVGLSAMQSLMLTPDQEPAELVADLPGAERRGQLTVVHSAARKFPAELTADIPAVVKEIQTEKIAISTTTANRNDIDEVDVLVVPLTIESVVNSFKPKGKKLSWQFFITPTLSNRKLTNNRSFHTLPDVLGVGNSNFPFANAPDVNNAVTHKPDIGLQLGFTARYPVSGDLRITGGFQFNLNRYDIKASLTNGEVARIELDGNNATVSTWSSYRSQGGSRLNWLKNIYMSVSVPLGAELILFRNKKATRAYGIAGTIQPTFAIRNKAYLVSTDYKNFAQVPWLVRDANINTGFEAFVQHNKGKTHWQVGPQARYQLLSSFNRKYPIRENLFDFGIKFGVTLNK